MTQKDSLGRGGVENLTNDTPPKQGFWTPPRTIRFPPLSGVSALFFLYKKNPRQSRPEALLEGSKNFRESAFSGTFPPLIRCATPPYHGPICSTIAQLLPEKEGEVSAWQPAHYGNYCVAPSVNYCVAFCECCEQLLLRLLR